MSQKVVNEKTGQVLYMISDPIALEWGMELVKELQRVGAEMAAKDQIIMRLKAEIFDLCEEMEGKNITGAEEKKPMIPPGVPGEAENIILQSALTMDMLAAFVQQLKKDIQGLNDGGICV